MSRSLVVVVALMGLAAPALAAGRYDPALRFHTLATPHFLIHFHQGEEAMALRLAPLCEEEHDRLVALLGYAPRARTHIVLVDQDDSSNGWTTPLPYNLIELTAAPPAGDESIGNTDDWLRMVFRHEYTHVLHLDRARGWASAVRHLFGRAPFAFPNLLLPEWQIEGLATFVESTDGQGRVHAGDFRAILVEASRRGRFEPIDRVNGGLVAWPSGNGWYAYGAFFDDYLARHYGAEALGRLSGRTAGRLPFLGSGAYAAVFGKPLGTLWREFEADVRRRAPSLARQPARLTHFGYRTGGPRVDRDGSVVFTRQDAHAFPSLARLPAGGGAPVTVTTRYGGDRSSLTREAIYFDQLEYVRSAGLVSDLYRLDRANGRVRRLTRGARLSEPDVSHDGRRIAAIRTRGGARSLEVFDRAVIDKQATPQVPEPVMRLDEADCVMASPRWSPVAPRIALERRCLHGPSEIVVVDVPGGTTTIVARSPLGRNVTPAWMPDGRSIVFASDRAGGPFQLYRAALAEHAQMQQPVQLTAIAGGAQSPDVSADGGIIVFVGYTTDGYDLFSLTPGETAPAEPTPGSSVSARSDRAVGLSSPKRYRPWNTLRPHAWLPIVDLSDDELRLGATTGGADALGYHAWASTVTWSVAHRAELNPVAPGARPDYSFFYSYSRWRPTFYAEMSEDTTPLLLPETDSSPALPLSLRKRALESGIVVPFRRVRREQAIFSAYRFERARLEAADASDTVDRAALRGGWLLDTSKRYGYSISRESGVMIGLVGEAARAALGGSGNATMVRMDLRGYVAVGPRHAVLAGRATASASRGDVDTRRLLRLGGPDGNPSIISFDEDASSLLRGFPANAFRGSTIGLINVEYRVPIAWIERGAGTWPVFLRSLHATVFADAGHAWTATPRLRDVKTSWGIEAASDVVAGFVLPLTLTAGIGWGHDGAGVLRDDRQLYVRLGYGF